jgi:hypothetical protein
MGRAGEMTSKQGFVTGLGNNEAGEVLDGHTNAGMCVAYMTVSAMGATVFFKVADWPVGLLFSGLFAIYFSDFFAAIGVKLGERALGLFHLATGAWLMYLTYAVAVDFSIGFHWRT